MSAPLRERTGLAIYDKPSKRRNKEFAALSKLGKELWYRDADRAIAECRAELEKMLQERYIRLSPDEILGIGKAIDRLRKA